VAVETGVVVIYLLQGYRQRVNPWEKTIAEKILSPAFPPGLKAVDFAICKVDFAFGQDGNAGLIFFQQLFFPMD